MATSSFSVGVALLLDLYVEDSTVKHFEALALFTVRPKSSSSSGSLQLQLPAPAVQSSSSDGPA
ncbi:hypothetical protein L1049_003883 [Liquidambar formosana]|uniref:Uncharacterized protein n=1 Tax=Liquidambar formosana TaxID=63359 RepID=A0AAP0RMH8_LIQFO